MQTLRTAFLALALLPVPAPARRAQAEARFPASSALAEGLSPEGLEALDRLVAGFVADEEVVGAELLVVKNGRSVLHRAYGWRDREERLPMEPGSVFCVRSMTKPLIGAAVAMLLEEDRLDRHTRAAELLSAFDVEGKRDITVEDLLTHASGLPLSCLIGKDLRAIGSVQAVAALGAAQPLAFAPGEGFLYSDQGADTLTALVEAVTGAPAEDFLRERLLEPLGMASSACLLGEDHPLRARACSGYVGSPGAWTRFWSPADPPLFPFFLGSQGLYSTAEDYARFLELFLRRGRGPDRVRLLRPASVRRTLRPGPFAVEGSTGFPGLRVDYGSLMQLWTEPGADGEAGDVVVFGHTGSDGTHAWAFPGEDALVLYFTQSRGTLTGLRVEERLGELFLGAQFVPEELAPPFEDYLGYYREDEDDLYRAIVRDGEDLALEIVGRALVPLSYVGDDCWKLRPQPATVLAFRRDERGRVSGYAIGDHEETRFDPDPSLPSAEELARRVASTHGLGRLAEVGPLHLRSTLALEQLGIEGRVESWLAGAGGWVVQERVGEEQERAAYDGRTVRRASGDGGPTVVEGAQAEDLLRDALPVRFGGWSEAYPHLEVVQRLHGGGDEVLLVRTGDASAPARTFWVDAATGRLGGEDAVVTLSRMGRIGRRVRFRSFREVGGMLLPERTEVELANPMIGPLTVTLEEAELGAGLSAAALRLEAGAGPAPAAVR